MKVGKDSGASTRARTLTSAVIGLGALVAVLTVSFSAGAGTGLALRDVHGTKAFWHGTTLKASLAGRSAPAVKLRTAHVRPFTLKRSALHRVLAHAPWENTKAARLHPVVVSLPAPDGRFERFALYRTAIMAPGLQRKHPEIATYGGRGVDDPAATIVADLSPFGFHASVRSPHGGWYIDPYYRKNPNVYVPYNVLQDRPFAFTEHGVLGKSPISTSAQAPNVPTGDTLRTYRLALITDPGYAAYVGPAAVTAAKVALIDRVDQPYHDDLSIRMQLIASNDLLNLNTWDAATAPNGPCGAAACFTQSQVTGCSSTTRARFVIGQIIGASNYDIGHLALGQPGGGVANLGVVGRSNKAGGCTGIPTPVGDFYAIDYVAHEMGHQFSGNHPFNGNQLNCSGGNRSAANSVEPGSGSSIMAYAGICLTDDLQRHSDPYFSERSQTEMSTYTSSNQAAINEVQTVSLRHFGGGSEVQTVTFGPGYQQAATIQPLSLAINSAPSTTSVGGADETGNVVTIATGNANTLQVGDTVTITGVAVAGYNGTFTVTSVPSTRSFTYTNPTSGLPRSGGGTITLGAPGLTESGNTVTVRTSTAHNRSVGDIVVIAGAGVGGYNGTWTIDSVSSARSFTLTNPTAGLANSGGGSATYSSPFQMKLGGNDSASVGGSFQAYTAANVQTALSALTGAGTVTVSALSGTGFTVTYGGSSANTDVPSFQIVNLSCGGCFASVEETNHGGANDSFTLNYNGNVSAPIVNGTNFTAAGIQTALQGVSEVQNVALTGYTTDGNSYTLRYNGNDTVSITRGQNNTAAGIQAAIQGGSEQQAVTLGSFNGATQSFQIQYGGNTSVVLGSGGLAISNANIVAAMTPLLPAGGTVSSAGAGNTGFTVTYGGTLANTDVSSLSIVNCTGSCTSSVRETVKGTNGVAGWIPNTTVSIGTVADTGYTVTFNALNDVSQLDVTNGTGGTSGSVSTTTQGTLGILPPAASAIVAGFGGGAFNNTGFQVTYGGTLALTNVPVLIGVQDFTAGASGFTGETDKGGAVDNQGTAIPTGNTIPSVSAPSSFTIPLRTPFALTGSATDADGDPLVYSWEQDDRGGSAGTALLNNTKVDGPLFAMFPQSGQISDADSLLYNSPGENHVTADPTRVFPDLQQILDNNTDADTGSCPTGPIAPPVPQSITECYSEFLPTSSYLGSSLAGNSSPLSLHMRFTARDGHGGSNFANTTLLLANTAGPFLVTAPNTAVTWEAGQTRNVTWDAANTAAPPVNAADVKISLSVDGGQTYPIVLAASTPNDGSQSVIVPNLATREARIKIEAVGNVFFDVSNANFTILLPGIVGLDSVTLGGKNLVDSYDASAGPYGPANTGDAASIFSNGAIALGGGAIHGEVRSADSSVALDKGGLVTGDVTAGGAITNKGTINGAVTPNTPTPEIAAPAVPACSPYSSAAGISGRFDYNDTTGDLTVSGGETATLAEGKYCLHNLILSGGAVLTVSGPVSIVLTGQLNASGGGVVNLTRVPSNLELASSFAGANGVILSGGSTGYLSVYAPRTSIALSGGSPVYGALLGKTLNVSGGSPVHYDVQLATVWAGYFGP